MTKPTKRELLETINQLNSKIQEMETQLDTAAAITEQDIEQSYDDSRSQPDFFAFFGRGSGD